MQPVLKPFVARTDKTIGPSVQPADIPCTTLSQHWPSSCSSRANHFPSLAMHNTITIIHLLYAREGINFVGPEGLQPRIFCNKAHPAPSLNNNLQEKLRLCFFRPMHNCLFHKKTIKTLSSLSFSLDHIAEPSGPLVDWERGKSMALQMNPFKFK